MSGTLTTNEQKTKVSPRIYCSVYHWLAIMFRVKTILVNNTYASVYAL